MKPTISKPFKSNDRTFDKVYNAFDKRDYFNSQGLAKVQIGNFERALKKNDKGAQQVLDLFKGDEKKAKDYITQVISDRNKERAFNNYKALKDAVDSIQKGKPNVGAVDYVKRIIHNSSQKYSIALYSTLRNKKFTKWKDVHNDIDSLIGEGFKSDAQRKAAFANGYEEKGKKNEGKKRFKRQDGIGKAKYTISYHDGKKKHKDGSDFFDIKIFKNKKDLSDFVGTLAKKGYKLTRESVNEVMKPSQVRSAISKVKKQLMRKWKQKGGYENFGQKELSQMKDKFDYNPYGSPDERNISKMLDGFDNWAMNYDGNMRESVNEASKLAMGIAGFTGTRGDAVDDFINTHNIDAKKLFNFVKKGNLKDRMAFVSAIAGRPNNKMFKMITKQFGESVNEVKVNYNFSEEELKRVLKLLGRNASTEVKMIKAFEKAFGRKLTRDELFESVNEGKVHFKKKLKSGNIFQVIDRDTKGMRGTQDKFFMQIVDKRGKLVKDIGSHPSLDGAKKYSNSIKEDKKQIKDLVKRVKFEKIFYDVLSTMEKKFGKRKYRIWLEKSLKDFGENPKHYDYRTNAAAEEKLFQLGK